MILRNQSLFNFVVVICIFSSALLVLYLSKFTVYHYRSLLKLQVVVKEPIKDDKADTDVTNVRELGLNHHIWDVYASSVDFLCNIPLFPKAPDSRILTDSLEIKNTRTARYAERIFGFLCATKSGPYKFAISSDESSELWLSSGGNGSKLIAYVGGRNESRHTERNNFTTFPSQISKDVELQSGVNYFIDILHVSRKSQSHLTVQWKEPGKSDFSPIKKEGLAPYIRQDFNPYNVFYDINIPKVLSCEKRSKDNPDNRYLRAKQLHYQNKELLFQALPRCALLDRLAKLQREKRKDLKLERFESLTKKFTDQVLVFPLDELNKLAFDRGHIVRPAWNANKKLAQEDAETIVERFWKRIDTGIHRKFTLKSIINIEKTNYLNGSRYLVELDVLSTSNETIHFSEYIYHHNNTVCYMSPWRRDVTITFVVTTKNQGKWLHIFLDNMASMIDRTQDPNVKAVIFDYDSQDIELEEAIAWRGLENRVKVMRKQGLYSRRESFNLAVKQVDDPHSIVFLLDLHLTIGDRLVNDIRKHTIEGQAIYTPVIIRQYENTTPYHRNDKKYHGFWETFGFGLVGIYKSDWDLMGGFPELNGGNKNVTYRWGGEDYDFMDQAFRSGLEYIRVKCPYVYHFQHSREGMWNNYAMND